MDDRDIGDRDAVWQSKEDVAPSPRADGCAIHRGAITSRKAGEGVGGLATGPRRCPPCAQHSTKSL
jgi:hypothetical protein